VLPCFYLFVKVIQETVKGGFFVFKNVNVQGLYLQKKHIEDYFKGSFKGSSDQKGCLAEIVTREKKKLLSFFWI